MVRSRRRLARWSVPFAVIVPVVAIGALLALVVRSVGSSLDNRGPINPRFESARRVTEQAVADARFGEPLSSSVKPGYCYAGGFMPKGDHCRWEGKVVLPAGTDMAGLEGHLTGLGWVDLGERFRGDDQGFGQYFKVIDGLNTCLHARPYQGVEITTTVDETTCKDTLGNEAARWDGWDLVAPDVVPERLGVARYSASIGDTSASVSLRFRKPGVEGPPFVEVRMHRLPGATGTDRCFGGLEPRPVESAATCGPLRTTPGGHELWVTSGMEDAYGSHNGQQLVRRYLVVVIENTVVEVEPVSASPAAPAVTDAEIETLVDSLHPVAYQAFRATYPDQDERQFDPHAYYDEPQTCEQPDPKIPPQACH